MEQQDQDPILMPGPQFNRENEESGWLQKNSQNLIIGVIIVLLGIGMFSFYKNYRDRQELINSAINPSQSPAASGQAANSTPQNGNEDKISIVTPEAQNKEAIVKETPPTSENSDPVKPIIGQNGATISVKAAKGEGATHLARQALKEYIKDKDLKNTLSPEQKIYIEDYLQKKSGAPKSMEIGQEIGFSQDLMEEAIDSAQNLSDSQLQNLQKYVPLVPSL